MAITLPLDDAQEHAVRTMTENRLTVVRAGPGSGKTRVFVEAFKRFIELERRQGASRGIAALSFTNVAHSVIAERLGARTGAPHFIGTIDGFMLRFVVRPFAKLVGVANDGVTLLPSPLDKTFTRPEVRVGPQPENRVPIYSVKFANGDEQTPTLTYDERYQKNVPLRANYRAGVLDGKRRLWGRQGLITHSDCQYLAALLLKSEHARAILDIVSNRFPTILVDEFQDTGWFLGRALLELLRHTRVRGVVVGDPDQAIYQFGGASRQLFEEVEAIPGAKTATLYKSHRCSRAVARVASALSRTAKVVEPQEHAAEGAAIMLVHGRERPVLGELLALVENGVKAPIAVLVRRSRLANSLSSGPSAGACPWASGSAARLHRAAELMRDGDPAIAARIVQRELADLVFDVEIITDAALRQQLVARGLASADWRAAVHAVLAEAARVVAGETWNAWLSRCKTVVAQSALRVGWANDARALGSRFRARNEANAVRFPSGEGVEPAGSAKSAVVMTVHMAKGMEFPTVMVVTPKPHTSTAPCPSVEWWSQQEGSEEREVAFVACSRAMERLVLAVHKQTFDALMKQQPEFVALLEVRHVDANLEGPGPAARPKREARRRASRSGKP